MKTIFIVVAVVLILGAGAFFFFTKDKSGAADSKTNPDQTTVEFSATDVEQIAAKPMPGSTLTTEMLPIPKDMLTVLVSQYRLVRYNTSETPEKIKQWFVDEFKKSGISEGAARESGVIVFPAGDHRFALYITQVNGQTTYVIGAGTE